VRQDYVATTFAVSTSCVPRSRECGFGSNGSSDAAMVFDCPGGFRGSVRPESWQFNYADGADPASFHLAAMVPGAWLIPSPDEPEIARANGYGYGLVLRCEITYYDLKFEVRNGSVTAFEPASANASTANGFRAPMAYTRVAEMFAFEAS